MVDQLFQILGAVLVLAAYAAAQFRLLHARSFAYALLILAGSAVLAWLALESRQWGFLLLEGTWALISLWAVSAPLRHSRTAAGTPEGADATQARPVCPRWFAAWLTKEATCPAGRETARLFTRCSWIFGGGFRAET